MKLLLLHGWAFDAGFWGRMAPLLSDHACETADRGYFGSPVSSSADGPLVVVTHSLGAMRALLDIPHDCRGLVAVNGFDRFTASRDHPGVARRVLDRMLARFEGAPDAVVAEFRSRIGAETAPRSGDTDRLREDLVFLRSGDCRDRARTADFPILCLHGESDPILPADMRCRVFEHARSVTREECPGGGHLLPHSHPDWCASRVERFVADLS